MFDDERWTRHRPGAGLLLLLVLAIAMTWPLWRWRGVSHPMADDARVDVCAWLAGVPPLDQLPHEPVRTAGNAGACTWQVAGTPLLDAALLTTRAASADGPVRVDRLFDLWRDEIRASGAQAVSEQGEAGTRVLSYRLGENRERLLEDHGVLLSLRSSAFDDARLDAMAAPMLAALREREPPPPPRKPLLQKLSDLQTQTR